MWPGASEDAGSLQSSATVVVRYAGREAGHFWSPAAHLLGSVVALHDRESHTRGLVVRDGDEQPLWILRWSRSRLPHQLRRHEVKLIDSKRSLTGVLVPVRRGAQVVVGGETLGTVQASPLGHVVPRRAVRWTAADDGPRLVARVATFWDQDHPTWIDQVLHIDGTVDGTLRAVFVPVLLGAHILHQPTRASVEAP